MSFVWTETSIFSSMKAEIMHNSPDIKTSDLDNS